MNWLGDYPEDFTTVSIFFTTHDANGAPLAPLTAFESDDVKIYKNGDAAQKTSTNGLTMTSPFDSITGMHRLLIDTSVNTGDIGFWVAGAVYSVVLNPDTETVNGQTVLKVLGTFGLALATANSAPSASTIASAVWDLTRSGHATSGTFGEGVASVQGAVTGSVASVSGNVTGSVGSVASGGIAAASFAASAITAAAVADGAIDAATFATGAITAAAIADGAIDAATFATGAITATVIADAAIDAATFASGAINAAAIASDAGNQIADALLDRANAVETSLTPRQALRLLAAVEGGKLSGGATTTNIFRNAVADTTDRVTATVDADGNRTAITYSL